MKGLRWCILLLVALNLFLLGFITAWLIGAEPAYAQVVEPAGISMEFIACPFRTSESRDGIFVIDTRLRRMNIYRYDLNAGKILLIDRHDLTREFRM